MSFFQRHKHGVLTTIIFHVILVLLLYLGKFVTPLPLPPEEGIVVNFGNSSTGSGRFEPTKSRPKPVVSKPQPKPEPIPEPKPTPKPLVPASQPSQGEKVMTQQNEQTVAMKEAEARRKKEEADRLVKKKAEAEKLQREQRAEQERLAKIEAEKRAAEEAERQRLEKERKERQAKERKMKEIQARAKNAFGGKANGQKNSTGEGTGYGKGNQGDPSGSAASSDREGGAGNGVSFSLSGRLALSMPSPNYTENKEGVVVVQVTVDKYGNVTKANPGYKGSTTLNQTLMNEAKKAALKAKFNVDQNAPAYQQGTITYRFVLD